MILTLAFKSFFVCLFQIDNVYSTLLLPFELFCCLQTGVHASAVIKAMKKGDHWLADRVYSGVPAQDYGLQQVIRIGHMSGRSNIIWWLQQNGYEADDNLVAHMFEVAKNQRRLMDDDEVHQAISDYMQNN